MSFMPPIQSAFVLQKIAALWPSFSRPKRLDAPQRALAPLEAWHGVARRNFVTVGIFSVFVNLLMLTIPIYLFQLADRVLTSRSMDTLVMLSLIAGGFILVLALLDVLRRQILGRTATRMETILGGPVLTGVVSCSPTGDGSSVQALRNLQQVRGFIAGPVMPMMFDAPLSPLYFAAVFLIHPDLGIIAISSAIALVVVAVINQRATSSTFALAGAHASRADANAEALARNSQVINAMGMVNESILHWGREQARVLTLQMTALDRNFWISGSSKLIRLLTQIALLGWGAYLALKGELTGGMMIAASIIAARGLQPAEAMIEGWRSLVQTRAAYERVTHVLKTVQAEPVRLELPKPKGRLSVQKLLYLPPGTRQPVLNGINFEIEPGESLAIVGPSGSGKSTLARILVGCLQPTAGQVRLDSTELRHWAKRQFGQFTGYLPQDVELFPGSIKGNVCRMRSDLPDSTIIEAAKLTGVHEMISHLPDGYETVLDRVGAPLSGGQKQRIALARAFFGGPSLVVLDEPNSNLDTVGEQALSETLRNAKERGVTVVVVTQRPAILNAVDKVLILVKGSVEAFGSPNTVLHRPVPKQDSPETASSTEPQTDSDHPPQNSKQTAPSTKLATKPKAQPRKKRSRR